jgi:Ca2+/Na+ antiporter
MDAIQKTAIVETAKTVGAITVTVIVIGTLIELLSLQFIATIALLYCLVMCIKMIYDTKVSQAEAKQAEINAEIDRLHK